MSSPDSNRHALLATWERLVRYQRVALHEMDESLRTAVGHSLEDYDVLHQVATHDGPVTMGALADRLVLAKSSCTRLVGRLVATGFLARERGARDRREVLVSITAAGSQLHRRMAAVHTRDIDRLFALRLSSAAAGGLDRALDELAPARADDGTGTGEPG